MEPKGPTPVVPRIRFALILINFALAVINLAVSVWQFRSIKPKHDADEGKLSSVSQIFSTSTSTFAFSIADVILTFAMGSRRNSTLLPDTAWFLLGAAHITLGSVGIVRAQRVPERALRRVALIGFSGPLLRGAGHLATVASNLMVHLPRTQELYHPVVPRSKPSGEKDYTRLSVVDADASTGILSMLAKEHEPRLKLPELSTISASKGGKEEHGESGAKDERKATEEEEESIIGPRLEPIVYYWIYPRHLMLKRYPSRYKKQFLAIFFVCEAVAAAAGYNMTQKGPSLSRPAKFPKSLFILGFLSPASILLWRGIMKAAIRTRTNPTRRFSRYTGHLTVGGFLSHMTVALLLLAVVINILVVALENTLIKNSIKVDIPEDLDRENYWRYGYFLGKMIQVVNIAVHTGAF